MDQRTPLFHTPVEDDGIDRRHATLRTPVDDDGIDRRHATLHAPVDDDGIDRTLATLHAPVEDDGIDRTLATLRAPVDDLTRSLVKMPTSLSRRSFLETSLVALPGLLIACRASPGRDDAGRALISDAASSRIAVPSSASAQCSPSDGGSVTPTEDNIEGPYYRSGAPFRADLVEAGIVGVPLIVTGNVLSLDCRSPLRDAVLDVWQADGDGHYDNDGSLRRNVNRSPRDAAERQDAMRLRGKVRVSPSGAFSFRSVLPGRYLNGRTYRPSHVHVKVSASGHAPLTTQLYFPDDPYNAADPFIKKSLVMDVSRTTSNASGHFDFVLTPLLRR